MEVFFFFFTNVSLNGEEVCMHGTIYEFHEI